MTNYRIIKPRDVVAQARSWLGTKYHHQGRLKKSAAGPGGVDCIGLVIGVIQELGIHDGDGFLLSGHDEKGYSTLPEGGRLELGIARHLRRVKPETMREGDLLLFKIWGEPQHIGLVTQYPNGGQEKPLGVIHCHSRSGAVVEHILSDAWRRMIVGVYRFKHKQLRVAVHG
jgi:cell wall-associated NlpC family hydrolase